MSLKLKSGLRYVYIILLGIFMAITYTLFIVPNNFAPAGINGIAVMVQYKLNFSVGFMSLIINIPLCVFAFFKVSRKFAVNTLLFCIVYSIAYLLLQNFAWLDKFKYNAEGVDTIYPVLIAGLSSGFTYGTLFRSEGSTGGTDVVAKYVSKRKPQLSFFWITFALNAVVAFASYFVYAKQGEAGIIFNYKPVCLCVLYCFTSSFVGSFILKGYSTATEFVIITTHPEEIEEEILNTLHHSATRIAGKGLYGHGDKAVLICVVNNHQMVEFKNIIKRYSETFAFVTTVNDTIGNFKKIK